MSLTPEDALRINVLLANEPLAIRIHESTMTLFGLSGKGETQVKLNPNCREDQYLRKVKEMLSGHVLGSPGGYPIYLQRWTRMGQMRDDNLDQLLLLGEPEAVVAVVCAQGLTDTLAKRAWWAMEDAENARRMLAREAVRDGEMGPILAGYLVEHLPFETEPEQMMDTVALVLQQNLVDEAIKEELWKRAKRKNAYYVGFLQSCPEQLPEQASPVSLYEVYRTRLGETGQASIAALLLKTLSPPGQRFLETVEMVMKKPSNQEVVSRLLDVTAVFFAHMRPEGNVDQTLDELEIEAVEFVKANFSELIARCVDIDPEIERKLISMRVLSGLSYGVIRSALRDSTAIGSLMRRKLEPVFKPLLAHIEVLRPTK